MNRWSGGGRESGEAHLVDRQARETFIAGYGFGEQTGGCMIAERRAAGVAGGYKWEFDEEGEERRGSGK